MNKAKDSDKAKSFNQCVKLFKTFSPIKPHHVDRKNKAQPCVNTWGYIIYFFAPKPSCCITVYKPVKTDLDGAPWFSLNDPLTAQGVLIVARPPRGQNDTRWSRVVAPTRS